MSKSTVPYALVVDDDAVILMHACDIIEEAGFRFFEAANGDEAIKVMDRHADSIVLLFSDVEMPGSMNGFALAHHVAAAWPHVEIVISSGRVSPSPGDMPLKATFIGKPFNADMVHAHLREILPEGKKPDPLRTAV